MPTWVLVHRPLLGPAFWEPASAQLRAGDETVIVPDLRPSLSVEGNYASRQAEIVANEVDLGPVVLVGHSAAGPVLPLVAERLAGQGVATTGSVFVDAGLPHPNKSELDVLPPPAVEHLQALTTDGWLPPWTSWWSADQLEALVPEAQSRVELIAGCRAIPASLSSEVFPPVDEQRMGTLAYIRLSSVYEAAADEADQAGWVVVRLDSHHLGLLTDPTPVVDALQAIITGIMRR